MVYEYLVIKYLNITRLYIGALV